MNKLFNGLKFKSVSFSMDAEIVEIQNEANNIKVKLTASDGMQWIEDWNLEITINGFKAGNYFVTQIDKINISVY